MTNPYEGSVSVDAQASMSFGGDVTTVLDSAKTEAPPATLEEARNQPGRREQIEAITRRIEAEGIKYVFFQQVSVTGRVMGKGVVATFFPQVAEKGYQLVYGATANLFTDRYGNYIGFGPEESELAAMADLETFEVLPWDPRVARVYCDCYDTETGELMDADEYSQALGLDMSYGDHEDAPGQLELNFRFDRPVRTADNITTYRQVCAAVGRKHGLLPTFMPKPFTGVSANGHPHHFTLIEEDANNVFPDANGPAELSDTAR